MNDLLTAWAQNKITESGIGDLRSFNVALREMVLDSPSTWNRDNNTDAQNDFVQALNDAGRAQAQDMIQQCDAVLGFIDALRALPGANVDDPAARLGTIAIGLLAFAQTP